MDAPPKDRASRVQAAIKAWKAQLIDLGGRNTLLYYRDQKVGTLDLTGAEETVVANLLVGRSIRLSSLFPDPLKHADAVKRARRIHAKAKEQYEERGILTLYLGCGLATWRSDKTTSTPNAPVLLRAATISARGFAEDDFDLVLSGEMEVNPTLLHLLETEFGSTFDQDELLAQIDGAIDTRWELEAADAWLIEHAEGVPDFAISKRIVLGNFSYAKLPMVKDLESAEDELIAHDIIAAIAGDSDARAALNQQYAGAQVALDDPDRTAPSDEFLVLDADASQNYAINAVLHGQDLIVRGPPGTGKSQTIANLIATALARGQTVLFVAEKRAAIDAVFRRLKASGLDGLLLDLHGGAGNRRQLAENLARSLHVIGVVPRATYDAAFEDLVRKRRTLNEHVEAVHRPREPWGISLYEARAQAIGVVPEARTRTRISGERLNALGADEYRRAREDLQQLADLGAFRSEVAESRWSQTAIDSPEQGLAVFTSIERLRGQTLPSVLTALERAARECSIPPSPNLAGWQGLLEAWQAAADAFRFFQPEIVLDDTQGLLDDFAAAGRGTAAGLWARVSDGSFRRARASIRQRLRDPATGDHVAFAALAHAGLARHGLAARSDPSNPPRVPPDLDSLAAQFDQLRLEVRTVEEIVGALGGDHGETSETRASLDELHCGRPVLLKLPSVRRLRRSLEDAGLANLITEMVDARLSTDLCAPRLDDVWLRSIVEQVEFADPRVGTFDAVQHGRTVSEFRVADSAHIGSTAGRIRRLYAERAFGVRDQYPTEAALISHQAGLKRGHLPLRRLFAQAPHVLQALKPCWAMSPLLVSQILPSDRKYFNLVVFDEASQIMPADAVPAILRGERLVVAGDDRQLPPTAFFTSQAAEDDSEAEELAMELAATKGFESILDSLKSLLRLRMLTWHYRSRDERLIAFSNLQFYDRSLTTFPGITGDDCLEHVLVPFRPGLVGQEQSAADEVRKVVAMVIEHAKTRPDESLGVIAMGITHATRIQDALRESLRDRPDLAAFFAEGGDEPFFVKNLERVQGDERDAIVLSIGYGKTPDGRLLYRFGPVNLEGGERRLNVAVTRAKRRMTVVSSFSAADMDPNRTTSRGAKLLRDYLIYAESHGSSLGNDVREHPELNPFEMEVRDRLIAAGVPVVAQLGASSYWIDFAAQHPRQPGRYVLAIECDGASYHSSPTARDRDRLRQEQLERLGWRFHRIWSGDWFADRERALERVVVAYQKAVADADSGVLKPPGSGKVAADSASAASAPLPPQEAPSPIRGPRPRISRWASIGDYTLGQLIVLVDWIESDTLLRTEDELIGAMVKELGFQRRGPRIVAAVTSAIRQARARRKKASG
jgi:very-short-patch-repair endonuclease